MSGNTTAIERLLEVSNKLWDAMYESGEVPTHAERSYYYLALKDAKIENAELHKLVADMWRELHAEEGSAQRRMALADRMRELGIEVTK